MIPHFVLRQNKGEFLIIRMGDAFHIIDCNEALTKEKRLAILEAGCTPEQMQEMGLSGTTIPKSDIKALTVTGCGFQDDVIFYLQNKKKLAYWLPQAYEQRKLDDFFRGIPRKMVKTRTRLKGGSKHRDWRIREQNFEVYQKLRPVGWVWNAVCAGYVLIPIIMERFYLIPMGWIVTAMGAVALLLDIFLPEYFTIMFIQEGAGRKFRNERGRAPDTRAINLGIGLFSAVAAFALISRRSYHLFDEFRVISPALIASAVVGVTLYLFAREFQEDFMAWVVTLLLLFVFNTFLFVPHFNHALGHELTPETGTIVSQHRTSGGRRSSPNYYCTVELPDGRELVVEVSRSEYNSYEIGDTMDLRVGTGVFGIDYAIDG